jgi:hypothetical protein
MAKVADTGDTMDGPSGTEASDAGGWVRRPTVRLVAVVAVALVGCLVAASQTVAAGKAAPATTSRNLTAGQTLPVNLAGVNAPVRNVSKATMRARAKKGCIPTLPCRGRSNTYLLVTIQPEYGMLAEFEKRTQALLPLYRSNGWTLVGAFRTVVGDAPTYINLWRVKDANQVEDGLTRSSVPEQYLDDIGAVIKTIKSESFQILTDASFASS